MHICRIVIENNRVTGEERLLADQEQRFRDITQGKDGALYAVTDQGRLYKINKKQWSCFLTYQKVMANAMTFFFADWLNHGRNRRHSGLTNRQQVPSGSFLLQFHNG